MKYIFYKKKLIPIGTLSIVYSSLLVLLSLLMSELINSITNQDFKKFKILVILTILIFILQILSQIKLSFTKNNYIKLNMKNLKYKLLTSLFSYDYSKYRKKAVSDYISFFNNDIDLLEENYYTQFVELISKSTQLLLASIAICIINPVFLILIIITMLLSGMIPLIFSKKLSKVNDNFLMKTEKCNSKLQNYFNGFSVIKSFNLINKVINDLNNSFDQLESKKCEKKNLTEIISSTLMCMTVLLTLLTFIVGGYLIFSSKLNIGILVALVQLLGYVIEPIVGIISSLSLIKSMNISLVYCDEILNYNNLNNDLMSKSKLKLNDIKSLELKNLSFSYKANDKKCINKISYKFDIGKKYAIVGSNGSGKSTLLKILAGYYNEYEGDIFINNIKYKEISENDKNSLVSYMEQNVFLFNWNINDNIILSDDFNKIKYEEIIKELKIQKILEQYNDNKIVPENLSGGEKQKIAIARCLLKNSPILIADEPTSALDIESKNIFEFLIENSNKINIIVTHDLGENLKKYDEILIMNNGNLINIGKYDTVKDDINNIINFNKKINENSQ